MSNENINYRLPLKLINSYTWAKLSKPARAILPVLGVHMDLKSKACWPKVETIAELAGYTKLKSIRFGMKNLIKNKLIVRFKEGRHYIYILTDLALWHPKTSYLPIYKEAMIINRKWANLLPCEKSLYPVFGNKGRINDPEIIDTGIHAVGHINKINKYIKWAGISRRSWNTACAGLEHKELVIFYEEEDSCRYEVYVPQYLE